MLCVRWYLRYRLSYHDLAEMMCKRGLTLDHTTIYRWVQAYAPEMEKRTKRQLISTNDLWRVDETYVKVRGAPRGGVVSQVRFVQRVFGLGA